MKQILSLLFGVVLAATAFGDTLGTLTLTASTTGPDRYADGSLVLAGETYLLVYVNENAVFEGVRTDGELVNTNVNTQATTGTATKDARCGMVAISYPASLYPASGKWALVLLDTRNVNGVGGLVVGVSEVTDGVNLGTAKNSMGPGALVAQAEAGEGLAVTGRAKLPDGVTPPVISSIEPTSNGTKIRVANVDSTVPYNVETTTDLASDWSVSGAGRSLQVSTHGVAGGSEIAATVTAPAAEARFFRVVINAAE
jgi:hypothetical protein